MNIKNQKWVNISKSIIFYNITMNNLNQEHLGQFKYKV